MQHGRDLEAQVRAELEQIMPLVSALSGLPTRWSGVVELVLDADAKGKKRFNCVIEFDMALANQDARRPTLIHESLHAHSAGYNGTDYRANRGWVEGVVEQLQRLLRPQILSELGVSVNETDFSMGDSQHPFGDRIQALESLRSCLGVPEMSFYRQLLATPIALRQTEILRQIQTLPSPQRIHALYVFSASQAVLKQYPTL